LDKDTVCNDNTADILLPSWGASSTHAWKYSESPLNMYVNGKTDIALGLKVVIQPKSD